MNMKKEGFRVLYFLPECGGGGSGCAPVPTLPFSCLVGAQGKADEESRRAKDPSCNTAHHHLFLDVPRPDGTPAFLLSQCDCSLQNLFRKAESKDSEKG